MKQDDDIEHSHRIIELRYGNSIWIDDDLNPHCYSDWTSDDSANVLNEQLMEMYGKEDVVQRFQDSARFECTAIGIK